MDTNVLIAAFATRGLCEDVFRAALTQHELVIGNQVLEELMRILTRKLRLPEPRAREITAFIRSNADVIRPNAPAPWPEADLDDQWVVAAAADGRAHVLVTGDRDLLDLDVDLPFQILTPRGFWEMLS